MLDDLNVLGQRDPQGALDVAAKQWQQAVFAAEIAQPEHDGRHIEQVVVTGMGGSALSALLVKDWLGDVLKVPFEVVRSYELPAYVSRSTLVIVSSYSGNTEETLAALEDARKRDSQVAIITSGGALLDAATAENIAHIVLPGGIQPRMATLYGLRALTAALAHFGVVSLDPFNEIASTSDWLRDEITQWTKEITTDKNYAKQLALHAVGKTPVIYGGNLTAGLAYKWKISWNENAKNVAFWNQYPEFNHNEFMGWTSHPVEKPFVVFDLLSSFENPRIQKRFEVSDTLLSGRRPKATTVELRGLTVLQQLVWGAVLADFVSIYVAILNGVDPTPVALIEKFKRELVKNEN